MKKLAIFTIVVLSSLYSTQVFAWGKNGHRIVGLIAEQRISKESKKIVSDLLDGQTMAMVANWPDEIRSDASWDHSHAWHYVSIDDDKKYATSEKNPAGDVVEAIERFSLVLKDKSKSKKERSEALKFLIHFVGDIHQPLHVGRASDRGGNSVSVKWFQKETNLHSVWDDEIIEFEKLSFTEFAADLNAIFNKSFSSLPSSDFNLEQWVDENLLYRSNVYAAVNDGKAWEYKYVFKHKNYVRQQLFIGGSRLARLIDSLLKSKK